MHIGFISLEAPYDGSGGGGIAAYLRAVIPGLIEPGHRVTVVAGSRQAGEERLHGGAVRVVTFRLPSLHWYLARVPTMRDTVSLPLRQIEWSAAFYRAARKVFDRDQVDVLETTDHGALLLAGLWPAPLIVRLHGSDYVFRKHTGQTMPPGSRAAHRLERAVWKRATLLTAPSRFQARVIQDEMEWSPARVAVIPNPIAPEMLAAGLGRRLDASAPSSQTVLYTGRLAPVKGTVPLLEAAKLVERACPDSNFLLAGPWQMPDSPARWGLQQRNGVAERGINWLGHVPWQQLASWYGRASVFVMPSYYETFGISVVEAMAFGLPVVASSAGGLGEIVEDGVTGILVPPGDARALAAAIAELLRDPPLRLRMGSEGRQRVLAHFRTETVASTMLQVYGGFVRRRTLHR